MSEQVLTKQEQKKKKSVQLSGLPAGSTAICTVGRDGKELRYRGYDINDLAEFATFEEVAYLLINGELPIQNELNRYRRKLKNLRGLPAPVKGSAGTNSGGYPPDGCDAHRGIDFGIGLAGTD